MMMMMVTMMLIMMMDDDDDSINIENDNLGLISGTKLWTSL